MGATVPVVLELCFCAWCSEEEVADLWKANCATLDNDEVYWEALGKTMEAIFNMYNTRKAIELMTGSRVAADAAIHLASRRWMNVVDFEQYLRKAILIRARRVYDNVYGLGSFLSRGEREKAEAFNGSLRLIDLLEI